MKRRSVLSLQSVRWVAALIFVPFWVRCDAAIAAYQVWQGFGDHPELVTMRLGCPSKPSADPNFTVTIFNGSKQAIELQPVNVFPLAIVRDLSGNLVEPNDGISPFVLGPGTFKPMESIEAKLGTSTALALSTFGYQHLPSGVYFVSDHVSGGPISNVCRVVVAPTPSNT